MRNFNFLLVHAHLAAVSNEATFVISFWQTFFRSMPLSFLQRAKRALVSVLLKLAFDYGVAVDINRESDDRAVLQCYRRVVKKIHPDKGGHKKTFQTLQVAKEAWDTARQGARPAGNLALVESQLVLASAQSKQYRVHAQAVLLTYSGKWSLQLWAAFVAWVRCQLAPWTVGSWCGHRMGMAC